MCTSQPLIGRTSSLIERFPLTCVWRQFGRPQDISQEYCSYARYVDESRLGWSVRLDTGRCILDVRGLVLSQWDYMGEVADGGVTATYQEYFVSHPFPRYTDPVGMGAPVQIVQTVPAQAQPTSP